MIFETCCSTSEGLCGCPSSLSYRLNCNHLDDFISRRVSPSQDLPPAALPRQIWNMGIAPIIQYVGGMSNGCIGGPTTGICCSAGQICNTYLTFASDLDAYKSIIILLNRSHWSRMQLLTPTRLIKFYPLWYYLLIYYCNNEEIWYEQHSNSRKYKRNLQ